MRHFNALGSSIWFQTRTHARICLFSVLRGCHPGVCVYAYMSECTPLQLLNQIWKILLCKMFRQILYESNSIVESKWNHKRWQLYTHTHMPMSNKQGSEIIP